jgi:hypothetical protein
MPYHRNCYINFFNHPRVVKPIYYKAKEIQATACRKRPNLPGLKFAQKHWNSTFIAYYIILNFIPILIIAFGVKSIIG